MGILAAKLKSKKLTKNELSSIVETVITRILNYGDPHIVYLFGSAIDGKMKDTSDFDFALIFENEEHLKESKKNILRNHLFPDLPIDLLFFTSEEFSSKARVGGICWEISKSGKVVYDKRTKI